MRIGIDLGGTNIALGLVDENGEIVDRMSHPTEREEGYEHVVENIANLIKAFLDRAKTYGSEVEQIGIGVPGIAKDGNVISAVNLYWENKPLVEDLDVGNIPIYLINDATAAAVAESKFGASKDYGSSVLYTLGTGIGGGIILDDKVITGAHGVGSEFGHMLQSPGFYQCNCGKTGCLETHSSASALIKRVESEVEDGAKTNLDMDNLNAKDIIEASKIGDEAAKRAINHMVEELSTNISNLVDVLDPEIFILGGGVAQAGDYLLNKIRQVVKEKITYKDIVGEPKIVQAQFGNDAGIIGAAFAGDYL